ncbi:ABC transporter ATP-binding protein [Rathayibacter soli]|uniref:ABC transporter ATP-binding protein n=1 Tax=Rathayibacter soli TaxID=3144168 RepID=UPI0027E4D356|nr:ABC transporter ATP-binding protein [Glaciibacter superstes]
MSETDALGPVLRAENLSRVFDDRVAPITAVACVSLQVSPGELLVIRGRSGSGKTTLLNLLGGLDRPTEGTVWLGELELSAASEDRLVQVRRRDLGFIFQTFGLVPVLSAAENVELPLRLLEVEPAERDARVAELLDRVGLAEHAAQRPSELSGGQQQRVGIARALAVTPRVLFADEPTGQLDSLTGAAMMDLLVGLVHDEGVAAVVTTHDPMLMQRADRVLELHDGRLRHPVGRHVAGAATR